MHAIGNAVRMSMSNLKIVYVSSKTFINEFIASIRTANGVNNQSFRDKYRNIDLLMIDDVQFLSKKPSTQEEIFHTFEALKSAGKQMVFASDRRPQDIPDLDSRVRSRFASSMVVDVQPPDLETRIAIFAKEKRKKPKRTSISTNLNFIAEHVTSNIREMEGVLTKVMFLSKLYERKVDRAICQEALKDYRVQECDEITVDEIVDCTCKYYNANKADVLGKKEKQRSSHSATGRDISYKRVYEYSARRDRRILRRQGTYDDHARARQDFRADSYRPENKDSGKRYKSHDLAQVVLFFRDCGRL